MYQSNHVCSTQAWIFGALSVRGMVINPTQKGINIENVVFAENERSVIMRYGFPEYDNPTFYKNWFVYAVARLSEPAWYATDEHSYIKNANGV
jgi:hypothetical protein